MKNTKKIIFISRHDVPANFATLLAGTQWANAPISHVRDAIDSIPLADGDLIVGNLPTSHIFDWVALATKAASGTFTLASMNMARVRPPIDGGPTLPPSIVDSLSTITVQTVDSNTGNDAQVWSPTVTTGLLKIN